MALLFCVVCGRGSNRSSWNYSQGGFVACDFHSLPEFLYSIANATAPDPNIVVDDSSSQESPEA